MVEGSFFSSLNSPVLNSEIQIIKVSTDYFYKKKKTEIKVQASVYTPSHTHTLNKMPRWAEISLRLWAEEPLEQQVYQTGTSLKMECCSNVP